MTVIAGVLGSTALAQEWGRTYEQLNDFADDWLALAKGILEGVPATYAAPRRGTNDSASADRLLGLGDERGRTRGRTTNVVVSSSHLLPLLIKCILFKLQRHIAVDHLYSSDRFGTEAAPGAGREPARGG